MKRFSLSLKCAVALVTPTFLKAFAKALLSPYHISTGVAKNAGSTAERVSSCRTAAAGIGSRRNL
jgi:hypothetical protein